MDADVGDVRGHAFAVRRRPNSRKARFPGGIELEQGRAELKSLGPFGPTAGRVAAAHGEDRGALIGAPVFSRFKIFPAESSNSRSRRGKSFRAVRVIDLEGHGGGISDFGLGIGDFGDFGLGRLEDAEVETAVDVDDFAGAEGERVAGDGGHGASDILRSAPAADGGQAVGDQGVVLGGDGLGHVRGDDPGPDFVDVDAMFRQAGGEERREHRERGFGEAIIAAVVDAV
jgi:hypothetical protein